jgi:hypothetical protein
MTPVSTDPLLLSVVRRVLSQQNFRVQETRLDGLDDVAWLLAESESFVLGVAAGQTLDDLLVLEGYIAAALGELIQNSELGAKRWDSYVVLLASSGKDQRGSPEVVRLQYNTRSLRRLVALGTAAHEDAVAAALATFLPLPHPPPGGLPSAFDELVAQLVINGIPEDRAASVVGDYRSTGAIHGA